MTAIGCKQQWLDAGTQITAIGCKQQWLDAGTQITAIGCKQQWLDSGTSPQELHHESLSAISDTRGEGQGTTGMSKQENGVTVRT